MSLCEAEDKRDHIDMAIKGYDVKEIPCSIPIIYGSDDNKKSDQKPEVNDKKLMEQFVIEGKKVEHFNRDKKRKTPYNGFFRKIWARLFGISAKFLWGDTKQPMRWERIRICKKKKCNKPRQYGGICMYKSKNEKCRYESIVKG